jgi:hypothetical protein
MALPSTAETPRPTIDETNLNVHELIEYLRPKPDEVRWRAIPWQTDLRDARRLATESRKPIFLWAMNGNPLGCT